MLKFAIIGLGGFIGAIMRYVLTRFVLETTAVSTFIGTLAVNIVGCLILGVIMQMIEIKMLLRPEMKIFLIIGLLGSFTTFSTFTYESYALFKAEEYWHAFGNVFGQITLGMAALWLGIFLGKAIKW